jgi:hypothetical protein
MKRLFDLAKQYRYLLTAPLLPKAFRYLILAAGVFCAPLEMAHSQGARMAPRIDDPVTAKNSVRVTIYGNVLSVPRFLVPKKDIQDSPDKPIRMEAVGFTFWYPSMAIRPPLSGDGRQSASGAQSGGPASQLKVYVSWLTYSSDDRATRAPRPSDILARHVEELKRFAPPDIDETPYPGLRSVSYKRAYLKEFPDLLVHPPRGPSGHLYIQSSKSPYELYMTCSSDCTATMYSKSHHFQMDVWIYGSNEQVAPQADKIFSTLNKIVDSWASR